MWGHPFQFSYFKPTDSHFTNYMTAGCVGKPSIQSKTDMKSESYDLWCLTTCLQRTYVGYIGQLELKMPVFLWNQHPPNFPSSCSGFYFLMNCTQYTEYNTFWLKPCHMMKIMHARPKTSFFSALHSMSKHQTTTPLSHLTLNTKCRSHSCQSETIKPKTFSRHWLLSLHTVHM